MPKKAQHIQRGWLAEAMDRYPGGRKAIAKALGLSIGILSEYVTGRKDPSVRTAIAIARMVGCDWTRFFEHLLAA